MTSEEAIEELEKGYPLEETPTEECLKYEKAVEKAIEALKNISKIEYLVTTYKQEGHEPHRVVRMEQLAYLMGMDDERSYEI